MYLFLNSLGVVQFLGALKYWIILSPGVIIVKRGFLRNVEVPATLPDCP